MMKHIFILIWNQRKANIWILAELFLASVCVWFVVDYFYVLSNIIREPLGFDISNTYRIDLDERTLDSADYIQPTSKEATTGEDLLIIMERIRQYPGIEAVSLSKGSQPYTATHYTGSLSYQQLYYKDTIGVTAQEYIITPSFFEVFRNSPDDQSNKMLAHALRAETIILPENTKEKLMGDESPFGKQVIIGKDRQTKTVEAICSPIRWTEYFRSYYSFYKLLSDAEIIDGVNTHTLKNYELCVRVNPESDQGFAENFTRDMANRLSVGNIYLMDVRSSDIIRKAVVAPEESNIMGRALLFIFILLNIFLGVSGTFMFRTQHRLSEMALRMATGSSRWGLRTLVISEGLMLLMIAILPAILVNLNIAFAGFVNEEWEGFTFSRFMIGTLFTYLIISLIIIIGIWYPARKVTRIQPALALHEE